MMKNKEIIKALECCAEGNKCRACCPYDDGDDSCAKCTSKLTKDALALINIQQADIERLKAANQGLLKQRQQSSNSCPFAEDRTANECMGELMKDLLEMLNRKDEEIARLHAVADAELDSIHALGDDYERVLEEQPLLIQKAKEESIKEFAARLKATDMSDLVGEQYINGEIYGYFYSNVFEIKVDNLVKEMTDFKE